MPRDSNGVYSLPTGYLAVSGEDILPEQHNAPLQDIATALTGSLPRNGSAAMTANLPMGGFKVTNAANGTAASDLATKGQLDAAIAAIPDYSDGANLDNGSVANSKLADMAQGTLKGRAAGAGTGSPVDVTDAQLRTIIGNVSSATAGLAPASGGGTVNFLRADGAWASPGNIVLATQQATTSGTQFDFTGLPAGLNEIVVSFDGVALSGTDNLLVQLGTSGGIEATGYVSTSVLTFGGNGVQAVNNTTGFIIFYSSSIHTCTGHMFIRRMSGNKWTQSHNCLLDTIRDVHAGGVKALSGEIDRIRITRTGTNTFAAGSVNISYTR